FLTFLRTIKQVENDADLTAQIESKIDEYEAQTDLLNRRLDEIAIAKKKRIKGTLIASFAIVLVLVISAGMYVITQSKIDTVLTQDSKLVKLNNFVGSEYETVSKNLKKQGFTVEQKLVTSSKEKGTIVNQSLESGVEVNPKQTEISFDVSNGTAKESTSSSTNKNSSNLSATDLSREQRALIITDYVLKSYHDSFNVPSNVWMIHGSKVDGTGSGKGSVEIGIGVNGLQAQYSLSGKGGVSVITGTYSGGNGDPEHHFTIDVDEWLSENNIDKVKDSFSVPATLDDTYYYGEKAPFPDDKKERYITQ
ncbi:MAG: PASTA domain-containing protein, partial [Lactobacillaceae bacterium]|nr:PASTA domain-containing protein [Lactobacillaceae bacterium]